MEKDRAQGSGLAFGRKPAWRVLGEEVFQALFLQVLEDSLLALFPGVVQGAGYAGTAGTVLHDATGNAEGAFGCFDGVPERDLPCRPSEAGASAAALFTLDQAGVGEAGQDAGQQAARDAGLGGDPIRRRPFPDPGEVDQSPQSVSSLAAQLESHSHRSLHTLLAFLLISVKADKSGESLARKRDD